MLSVFLGQLVGFCLFSFGLFVLIGRQGWPLRPWIITIAVVQSGAVLLAISDTRASDSAILISVAIKMVQWLLFGWLGYKLGRRIDPTLKASATASGPRNHP